MLADVNRATSSRGKVFVLGVSSILGWSIARFAGNAELFCNEHTRIPQGMRWRRLNLQNRGAVRAVLERERPALVIHCAGICDVDKCRASPEFAHEVNVLGMENLIDHLPAETRVVYLSSDHVFSGDTGPYTESSPPDPLSVYGRTRVLAEGMLLDRHERSLVLRTGLWIGPSYNGRLGHLDWLRYRHGRGLPMTVIADEHRSAVWADDAVARVLALADSGITGIRHVVASRIVDRPTLARYLDRENGIGARFAIKWRRELHRPHLGRMDLRSEYRDALAAPLTPVVPEGE